MQTPPLRSKIAKDRCTKSGLLADPRRQRTTRVDSAAPDACNGLCFGAGWQGDQLTHAVAQNTSGRGVLVNVRLEGRTFDRHVRPAVPRTPPAHLPRPRRTAPASFDRLSARTSTLRGRPQGSEIPSRGAAARPELQALERRSARRTDGYCST